MTKLEAAQDERPSGWTCYPGDGCEVVLVWPGKVHPA